MSLFKHLKSAASLFIETPSEPPKPQLKSEDVPSLDDIDLELPPEAQLRRNSAPPPKISDEIEGDESLDFPDLYRHFSIPATPFSAEQLALVIANLPAELEAGERRETVLAMLRALEAQGVTPESVAADAIAKIEAINAALGQIEARANQNVEKLETHIAGLQKQIEAARREVVETRTRQSRLKHECEEKLAQMTTAREFFGPTVAASAQRLAKAKQKNPN